jgi:glycosyltransferase involved in cell wall biosynthesis
MRAQATSADTTERDTDRLAVSVVIPARNEESYLEVALESVVGQDYPIERLDCVVVDNASGDGTAEVGRLFAQSHRELNLSILSEPVPGVGRAKNRGAEAATGDVVIFLDADSRMDAGLVEAVESCYRAGSPAGSIAIAADSKRPLDRAFFALMEFGKVRFGIRSQMMYCDRALFESLGGFRPDLHIAEDLEFLKRVKRRVHDSDDGRVCHVRAARIMTSARRLHARPFYLGMVSMFARWLLAFLGIGRGREY